MRRAATTTSCVRPVLVTEAEPERTPNDQLIEYVHAPWMLRVGSTPMIVRPSSVRDLAGVAQLHTRCSPRSLLDRYRAGGRPPAVAALDATLREPFGVVVALADGTIIATGTLGRDRMHNHLCAQIGLLVQDSWQRMGIGTELTTHLAGVAHVAGFHELIAYPATAVGAAQRLMIEVGRTRMVPDRDAHMHTYLPEAASLGLGSVRQRLAG
jgi:GNAT superfamily N-acetyltransferase